MPEAPTTAELMADHQDRGTRGNLLPEGESRWDPPIPTDRETEARHGHWKRKRDLVIQAMTAGAATYARLHRFQCCGSIAVVEYSAALNKHRVTCWHCRDRMCEPCQAKRQRELAEIVKTNVGSDMARFVTLSIAHSDDELKSQVRRLRQCFNKLKRTKTWKTAVRGGVAILEIKRQEKHIAERDDGTQYETDGRWHPHLHVVCTGTWIDRDTLSAEWHKITKDSWSVDVRMVKDTERACHYIAKYVTKATNFEVYERQEWLAEFMTATKGARVYNVFGAWKSVDADEDEAPEATDWKPVTTIHDLLIARDRNERWAVDLWQLISKKPADLARNQKPRPGRKPPA